MIWVAFASLRNGCNWSAVSSLLFSSKYSTFSSSDVSSIAEVSSIGFKCIAIIQITLLGLVE